MKKSYVKKEKSEKNLLPEKNQLTKKLYINVGKFLAIMAVLLDHNFRNLYSNLNLLHLSFFSVSLFILLSGVTSYISCKSHYAKRGLKETLRRISSIFIPYVVASAVYLILNTKILDFDILWQTIWSFNASGPFYFVLFYIELIVISPFLFELILLINSSKYSFPIHLISIILQGGGGAFCYSNIPSIQVWVVRRHICSVEHT
jgi:hypothetical protein